MMQSIEAQEMLEPIVVDSDFNLICGYHRLEAYRRLGRAHIEVVVKQLKGPAAELAEIDENLIRHELTTLEQGELLVERERLLQSLGRRAKPGGQAKRSPDKLTPSPTTTEKFAQECHMQERTAQRRMKIAREICPAARDLIRLTPTADSQGELELLASMPEERQKQIARLLADGKIKSVSANGASPAKQAAAADGSAKAAAPRAKRSNQSVVSADTITKLKHQLEEAWSVFDGNVAALRVTMGEMTAAQNDAFNGLDCAKVAVMCAACDILDILDISPDRSE
jgi:hypothetical protein